MLKYGWGNVVELNLEYVKRCSLSKMKPDTWSKIVFQHQAKHGKSISLNDILSAVEMQSKQENIDIETALRTATFGLSTLKM